MATGGKIFNIGMHRAATKSLAQAMEVLGLDTIHYRYQERRLYDIFRQNHARGRKLLTGVEQFDAYLDFAGATCFKLLDQQYPGSRFIVTTRELESWLDSKERHTRRNAERKGYRYGLVKVDRDAWVRQREEFLADVDRHFAGRADDLLVLDIPGGDGWEQLCGYLGKDVPTEPFPVRNISFHK